MTNTKDQICSAFRSLVLQQPLDSISVQAICDKADLSRKTFSRHFGSILDIVVYQINIDFIMPQDEAIKILRSLTFDTPVLIERNLDVFKENGHYYKTIINKYGSAWFSDKLASLTLTMSDEMYTTLHLQGDELDFIEHFFAHAMASVYLWWAKRDFAPPAKEVARLADTWIYARCRELM